jgi:hypothetical protein
VHQNTIKSWVSTRTTVHLIGSPLHHFFSKNRAELEKAFVKVSPEDYSQRHDISLLAEEVIGH